ncbi:hypothetical protein OYC64_003407 [Pagothenia borchgrevinki]|uniref:Uncharacterized protein n=1 Tax=Pagothenia borchgrevinki TaxID=8213 RepID=A0ABD2FPB8_PAGBO
MTRCLSNGPRCISIRSVSIAQQLLSRSPARCIMGRKGGHPSTWKERERGGPQLSPRDPRETLYHACAQAFVN